MEVGPTGAPSPTFESPIGPGPAQELDRNAFLRLLLTQLENQDPLEPLDNQAFIAQLAEFSSLEKLTDMSDSLRRLVDLAQLGLDGSGIPTDV